MNRHTDAKTAKVIPLRQKAEAGDERAFVRRWGARVADHGYTSVPHMFFALQAELGLTCQQAMVLLHLLDHWWHTSSGSLGRRRRSLPPACAKPSGMCNGF
jgi:hypothetical protein